jgi:hypothetical protein
MLIPVVAATRLHYSWQFMVTAKSYTVPARATETRRVKTVGTRTAAKAATQLWQLKTTKKGGEGQKSFHGSEACSLMTVVITDQKMISISNFLWVHTNAHHSTVNHCEGAGLQHYLRQYRNCLKPQTGWRDMYSQLLWKSCYFFWYSNYNVL